MQLPTGRTALTHTSGRIPISNLAGCFGAYLTAAKAGHGKRHHKKTKPWSIWDYIADIAYGLHVKPFLLASLENLSRLLFQYSRRPIPVEGPVARLAVKKEQNIARNGCNGALWFNTPVGNPRKMRLRIWLSRVTVAMAEEQRYLGLARLAGAEGKRLAASIMDETERLFAAADRQAEDT